MFIFFKSKLMKSVSVAIPSENIISIRQTGDEVYIVFNTGEMEIEGDETNGAVVALPVTSSYKVKYSSVDAAEREMFSFYQAILKGQQAFLFADEPESFEKY